MLYSSSTQLKPAHNWVYIIQQKLIQKSHITLRLLWGKECTKREYKEHFFISFKYLIMWFSLLYTSNCAGKLYKCCIAFQYHCINLGVQSYKNDAIITKSICLQNILLQKLFTQSDYISLRGNNIFFTFIWKCWVELDWIELSWLGWSW